MGDLFRNMTPQQLAMVALCVGVLVVWNLFRWKRASKFVEGRNKLFSAHYEKMNEYFARVRSQDSRWAGFLSQMQNYYPVIDTGTPPDAETFEVHYCFIWDETGRQYEPGEDTEGKTSMSAFLRRKAKPKYLRFQLSSTGEVTEHKVSRTAWYDMFEKSV